MGGHGWTIVYYDEIASLYVPADEEHAALRDRALRAFAELKAQRLRQAQVPATRSLWQTIGVPVAEPQRQSGFGDFLRAMGQYQDAISAYERALALDPDRSWTRYELGVASWFAGDRQRALREWHDVLRRDPGFAPARRTIEQLAAVGP